jgi:hypothetical protein
MVKVPLHRVKVQSGSHKGQYHLIAQRGAIKAASASSGRSRSTISGIIQRRKKKYGYAGYKKKANSLPETETLNLRTKAHADRVFREKQAERYARGNARRAAKKARRAAKPPPLTAEQKRIKRTAKARYKAMVKSDIEL